MSSIMRRRNGLTASSVMGMLLFWVRVATPSSQNRTPGCTIVLAGSPAPVPYRASGLVHWRKAAIQSGQRVSGELTGDIGNEEGRCQGMIKAARAIAVAL